MYLLKITNLDYIIITGLFALFITIAYLFRRNNYTDDKFIHNNLYSSSNFFNAISLFSFGIIEFFIIGFIGASQGFAAMYIVLPIILIINYLSLSKSVNIYKYFLNPGLPINMPNNFYLISYVMGLILAIAIAINILATWFHSLLGWQYMNSVLAVCGYCFILLQIGGIVSTIINQAVGAIISIIILATAIYLGFNQLVGIESLITNLQQAALNNSYNINYFLNISTTGLFTKFWLTTLVIVIYFTLNPISYFKSLGIVNKFKVKYFIPILSILITFLMFLPSILAIALPTNQTTLNNGTKIVTTSARFEDGTAGYIVKAIPTNHKLQILGLIPPILRDNNDANIISNKTQQYEYSLASLVTIKQVLPFAFVLLVLILVIFFKSITDYLSAINMLAIKYAYMRKYNKSGEELENVWAARVLLLLIMTLSITSATILYKFANLEWSLALLFIWAIPLVMKLVYPVNNLLPLLLSMLVPLIIFGCTNIINQNNLLLARLFTFNNYYELLTNLSIISIAIYVTLNFATKLLFRIKLAKKK